MALEYIGKSCDLARRKFVGLGHCCGDPASHGCSGLAGETITKAPLGQGPFVDEKMLLRYGLTRSSKTYTADEPHRLAVHREVYIHLAELSTSENLTNGQPSTHSDLSLSKTKNGVAGELYHCKSCNIKGLRRVLFRS